MKKEHNGVPQSPQQSDSDKSYSYPDHDHIRGADDLKPKDIAPETCIIGGKAMAKLIDVIADLYRTGPYRKLDALADVAIAIKRANMEVKHESDGRILNFDDLEELSDVTEWLMMETDGLYHIVFRDGYECKHEVDAEEEEEVGVA